MPKNHTQHENTARQSLDGVLSGKYPWLLRWALSLTQNNRSAAEDLVQECLVRVLSLRSTPTDLDRIEPLLYTHLRYAHLTERRRISSEAFHNPEITDFDTFLVWLRRPVPGEELEAQNQLRRILAFLLWRRRTAKFASIFLLRFFHGFEPQQIAEICLVSRRSVDLSLLHARRELKAYLEDSSQLHIVRRQAAPSYKTAHAVVPSDDLALELRGTIFSSVHGACPTTEALERHYHSLNRRAFDTGVLAHIVSCAVCLDKAAHHGNVPPPSTGSMEEFLKHTRRPEKSARSDSQEKRTLARILSNAERKGQEAFHHRPSGLVIALNGETVAVRDIGSARAVLKVETRSVATLDMIEVFSEQGVLLLAFALLERPPQAPPELRHEIALSDDRRLALFVRFNAEGAVIESTYFDPHYIAESALEGEDDRDGVRGDTAPVYDPADQEEAAPRIVPVPRGVHGWSVHLWGRRHLRPLWILPLASLAVGVLVTVCLLWPPFAHQREQLAASNLIRHAVRAENGLRTTNGAVVVHQRVSIRTAKLSYQLDLYRDLEGRRHAKAHPLDQAALDLKDKLAAAGLDWDDPLSASSFQAWHNRIAGNEDNLDAARAGVITVTTMVAAGPVLRESLTVRQSDFHPIARAILLRDRETIEVAELSYDIIPWNAESEKWFEPLPEPLSSLNTRSAHLPLPSGPAVPSEAEIDLAYLNALFELRELHADTGNVQITRTARGVMVSGVVDTENRKQEIVNRMRALPHVATLIQSYEDLDAQGNAASRITNIEAMAMVAAESPLDGYCEDHRVAKDRCQHLAVILMSSSSSLLRESRNLRNLLLQYPATRPLSPTAHVLLDKLIEQYAEHLSLAVQAQEAVLAELSIAPVPDANLLAQGQDDLDKVLQRNLLLAKELVYPKDEHSGTAGQVLRELAASARQTHASVTRITAPSKDYVQTSSGNSTTLHHN